MSISIQREGPLLRIRYAGLLTPRDLSDLMAWADGEEARMDVVPDRISDLSEVTGTTLSMADVNELAQHRKSKTFPNPFRSAIVAPDPAQWGIVRMFQTLNDHTQITIRLFGDAAAALAWLEEARTEDG